MVMPMHQYLFKSSYQDKISGWKFPGCSPLVAALSLFNDEFCHFRECAMISVIALFSTNNHAK